MNKWPLEHCPVCQGGAPKPVEYCRRCGAHLLLLAKAWNESEGLTPKNTENKKSLHFGEEFQGCFKESVADS